MRLSVSSVWLLILIPGKLFAQSGAEDSLLRRSAYQHTVFFYENQLGDQTALNNGSRYEKYPYRFRLGSAYFPTDQFTTGSVVYDGIFFDSLSLLYDDLQQVLVLRKDGYDLQLVNEKISSFRIGCHLFVRPGKDSLTAGIPGIRFYELLYSGRSRLLKNTEKSVEEEVFITDGIPRYMVTTETCYIKWGNLYIPVKSKEGLLNLMTAHKKEIRRFIEKNGLSWDDKENLLIRTAAYYDQLVK